MTEDARLYAPSAARNRDPILNVLKRILPTKGLVLEIASGSGEHITHFAQGLSPTLNYLPTDPDETARRSIDAWVTHLRLTNVRPAIALDASTDAWPITGTDAVVAINMIHISPWASTLGLMRGAARCLPPGGVLFLYGPYKRNGVHTAPSNEAFDQDLQSRNPAWGIRNLETVAEVAATAGFSAPEIVEMPANNLSVIFRRQ